MHIKGLQKLSLLDYAGHVACTVFTGGCNFRCPFCHNATLVVSVADAPDMSEEEFFSFLKKRSGILDGVCVSGGEPTLMPDIIPFLLKIKELGYSVKLDTNGAFPERLEALLDKGLLDYVAMDVKNSDSKYGETVGLGNSFDISVIDRSIDIIMKKAPDYEFRTTVVRELHDLEDLLSIAKKLKDAKKYFLQKYVDSGDVLACGYSAYEDAEMLSLYDAVREVLPVTILRGV